MAWSQLYPPNITSGGDATNTVLGKFNSELVRLYTVVSGVFHASTGHAHTGTSDDAPQITAAGIANDAVETAKIKDAQVTVDKLADDAVETAKIKDGQVTIAKVEAALSGGLVPIGGCLPFSGTFGGTGNKYPLEGTTPNLSWHITDGTDGTVDLRNKFVLVAGSSYAAGSTGGEATHVLLEAELPAHHHVVSLQSLNSNSATGSGKLATGNDSAEGTIPNINTGDTGSGTAHNNMPPYYALAYIQRIA